MQKFPDKNTRLINTDCRDVMKSLENLIQCVLYTFLNKSRMTNSTKLKHYRRIVKKKGSSEYAYR
jgi:hypothetical protein